MDAFPAKLLVVWSVTLYFRGATALDDSVGGVLRGMVQVGQCLAQSGSGDFRDIELIVYTPDTNVSYKIADAARLVESIDASRPTVIYLHGFTESRASESVQVVAKAFLERGSHNFVLIDYGEYVKQPYVTAVLKLPAIAEAVGAAVNAAVRSGLSNETLWIVGHSLGGQLAGAFSRHLDFKPPRITGLDPALPGFGGPGYPSLGRDDAVFVDVIHTDAGLTGFDRPCGHVDFWPNGGRRFQPGCPTTEIFCSHWRSWQYFAESVTDEQAFPAVPCDSWRAFQDGGCPDNDNNHVFLGFIGDKTALRGSFYLTTSKEPPYALGRSGLSPSRDQARWNTHRKSRRTAIRESEFLRGLGETREIVRFVQNFLQP